MTTWLHERRLDAVQRALRRNGAHSVLDLGCGEGPLLRRLVHEPEIVRIVGIDQSAVALEKLQAALGQEPHAVRGKVELRHGSFMVADRSLLGFNAAILIETIEHTEPERLSVLEGAVFRDLVPETVVISTPNREFNVLLGVPRHRHRHADHCFEWDRSKFQSWAVRLARRNSYDVQFEDVAGAHPVYGGPTQMATFRKAGGEGSRLENRVKSTSIEMEIPDQLFDIRAPRQASQERCVLRRAGK